MIISEEIGCWKTSLPSIVAFEMRTQRCALFRLELADAAKIERSGKKIDSSFVFCSLFIISRATEILSHSF